ncbi:MAG: preprotein translocase subunit YajC, partial [Planctomycetota bacterium]
NEQKRRDAMLKALKKNDRVLTSGGMIGTVANLSADGKEVTVKFGENTRIPFLRSSIQSVLTVGEASEKT